ncbi:MmgE/PrpD family protein [Duganella violaceipulchra]|uniref:2-methylcitrate dehydratase PrpD n=1 Tax=Duganella violaceipulchra TaxID=2849652 RepID=A0AA41L0B6_9BURK|nr:MmgE/PrpD family protein [Duganella violaceicalia]MBV6322436.1 MmgE/PrpD family protein [Duganella violaceicalia]MCP2010637.1 2-methylcitrate dehydratase PrpD [Duganella violaceicalia]
MLARWVGRLLRGVKAGERHLAWNHPVCVHAPDTLVLRSAGFGAVLGLDVARFEHALGLAGTQSGGLMAAQHEAMSKRTHHGFSHRNGLYAAFLA